MKKLLAIIFIIALAGGVYAAPPSAPTPAKQSKTDVTNFGTNLSSADDTVQKALDTLDEVTGVGDSTETNQDDAWSAVSGGTETGIDVTYQDGSNDVDFVVDVTPSSGSATLEISEDAVQVKYDSTDFQEGANGLYLGDSPTIATSVLIGADPGDTASTAVGLPNAAVISFEDATETTITHVDNVGLLINLELEIDGTLDADGVVALGDGGDNFSVASDGIDISTGGAITNAASIGIGADPGDSGVLNLENAAIISWEDATETTLTHVDNTGLAINLNLEAATITEGGNAVYNSTETPGGELGGTWASPTIDDSLAVTSWNLTTPTITSGAVFTGADASPNADGELVYDTTVTGLDDGALAYYGGADTVYYIVASDVLPVTNDHVLAYNSSTDRTYWKADADTGGAPPLSSVTSPEGASTLTFGDTEILTWTSQETDADPFIFEATGIFGDISIFKIEQKTGNATDGDLLHLVTADANVDHLLIDYAGTDYVTMKVIDAGTFTIDVTSDGTAAITLVDNTTISGDLIISGGDLDFGNVAVTIGANTEDSFTFDTDGTGDGEIVLPDSSISGTEILDDTIDSADYAAASIDAEHLAADIVDETKIADDGIDSEHYNDASIDAAHLAADVIDETKIADDGIDSEHYNDASIDLAHLAAGVFAKDIVTTSPVTGATDNVLVGADSDVTLALDFTATWDFNGATALVIPTGTASPASTTGSIALDTNGDGAEFDGPMIVVSTSGATMGYIVTTAGLPGTAEDNYVIKYAAGTDTVQWEADSTGSALGTNLASTSNDITTDNAIIQLEESGGNSENLTITFAANDVAITSDSGVLAVDFGTINLETDALDLSAGTITNVAQVDAGAGAALALGDGVDDVVSIDSVAWDISGPGAASFVDLTIAKAEPIIILDGTDNWEIRSDDTGNSLEISSAIGGGVGDNVELEIDTSGNVTVTNNMIVTGAITEGGIAVLNNDEMDASSELLAIIDDETGTGAIVFGTAPTFTTSIAFNAVTDTVAGIQNQNLVDKAAAEAITGAWEIQDNTAFSIGNDADWAVTYDETTDDRLEFVNIVGTSGDSSVYWDLSDTADSTYTITNTDVTAEANLVVEGDISYGGTLIFTGSGDNYMEMTPITAWSPSGAALGKIAFEGASAPFDLNFWDGAAEYTVVHSGSSVTWAAATSHSYAAATQLVLPTAAADASGEISISTGDQLKWHDGTKVITIDTTPTTDNYVLKYDNASATFTLEADETGGTPAWNSVTAPTADVNLIHPINVETQFTYTGDFTTGTQFNIEQLTGNPTGGVLFAVKAADSNVIAAQIGDGSNLVRISQLGAMTFVGAGSGITPVPPSSDGAALGSDALDFSDLWLADGAKIDFDSGDLTLTHSAELLTFAGGAVDVDGAFTATTLDADTDFTVDGLVISADTITNDANLSITATGTGDITLTPADDVILDPGGDVVQFLSTSADVLSFTNATNVWTVGSTADTITITPATTITGVLTLTNGLTGTVPWAGTAILESGAAFQFGDASDATLTHTYANTGTNVSIAYSSAEMAVTGALSSTTTMTVGTDLTVTGNDVIIGSAAAGVTLTGDGDGQLTIAGFGDGSDENITINLDDTANEAVIGTGTGVTTISTNASNIGIKSPVEVTAADADGEVIATADLNTVRISSGAGDWGLPADSCDSATGNWLTVVANAAHVASIESLDTSDQFYLTDGTGIGANEELDTGGSAWDSCTVVCVATNTWLVIGERGTCADGGAKD